MREKKINERVILECVLVPIRESKKNIDRERERLRDKERERK